MKINKLLFFLAGAGILATSCQTEDLEELDQDALTDSTEVPQDILDKIASLHFNTEGAEIGRLLLPDGTYEKTYIVEGDIVLNDDHLEQMSGSDITSKQYRTFNLVRNNRNVNVIGFTGGGGQGLTSKQRSALQLAIANFNALNIGLNFTLTFGTNYTPYDIVVYQNPNGQAGGVAGFPSGGNPYKFVQIFSGMQSYSTAVNEHVMTHEIGHAVGLRHTDWFSRQSCGQSGEGSGSDGAVHIPGTPTGYDSNSIMLACFNTSVSGNFGFYDRVALEYLY